MLLSYLFVYFSSSAYPQTDTAQLHNTHPDSCTHMDGTGLEFNLSFVSLQNKNNSHCHLDIVQNRWILWMTQEKFKKWNQIKVGDRPTFPVSLQWFQVLVPCCAATSASLLTHGIHRDYRKTFLVINFLRLIHPEIILKEFNLTTCKETEKPHLKQEGLRLFTHKWRQTKSKHNSNADICDKAVDSTIPVRTAKTANIRIAIRQIPQSTIVFSLEKTMQNTSHCLFWFSIGSYVVDQRSGDGWFFGRVKILAISLWKDFPNFEMLDTKIASALNKIIQNSQFKKQVSLEEQKAQKEDRCLRGRQIAFMIYDYFRVTGAHDTVLDYADLFSVSDDIQEFDTRWSERSSTVYVKKSIRWYLGKSVQVKDTWVCATQNCVGIVRLKTTVKTRKNQKLLLRNFDARHGRIETGAVVKNRKGMSGVEGGKGICYQWKEKGQCSKGDHCSFRHESDDRA